MPLFENRHIKMEPEHLKALMEEHDISSAELAEVVGTSQPAIAAMRSGKRNITKKMTARIYDGLEWYLKPMTAEDKKKLEDWYVQFRKTNPLDDLTLQQLGGRRVLGEDEDFDDD